LEVSTAFPLKPFKMNSLKQVIITAFIKVSSDPMYAGREYASADAARDDFIKALIAELFPECPDCVLPSAVQASEVVVVEEADGGGPKVETLPERVAKRKLSKEEKEAEKKAKEEAKKAKEEAKEAEKKAKEETKEKKKPGPKPKAVVEAPVEVPAAAPVEVPVAEAPVKEKKKPGPKPKVKADGPVNLEKLNPTQTKKLKSIAEELKVEADKKAFHDYLNSLPKEEYDAKTFDDHARAYLTPVRVVEEPVLTKCARVEWPEGSGVTYLVDPETKKVYKPNGSVNEYKGDAGMLEFEGLEIPAA